MTKSANVEASSNLASWDVPKVRQCLRCKDTFHSTWSGERICSHSKRSNAWRNATPNRSYPSRNKR
jgi:hypothetical protein